MQEKEHKSCIYMILIIVLPESAEVRIKENYIWP
jgi:hypothetical protein